jgi:hypothetical protein
MLIRGILYGNKAEATSTSSIASLVARLEEAFVGEEGCVGGEDAAVLGAPDVCRSPRSESRGDGEVAGELIVQGQVKLLYVGG